MSLRKKILNPIVLFVALVIMIILAGYFYWENTQLRENTQLDSEREVQELVERVSRLIVLPEGEIPTVATVSDPDLLRDQPFFYKAQVGDKVLIYTNARRAILYNPNTDKIVEVAPLNIGDGGMPANLTE